LRGVANATKKSALSKINSRKTAGNLISVQYLIVEKILNNNISL
jgi:hypothetical protein